MTLFYRYDELRLKTYSAIPENRIQIKKHPTFNTLCFPEVGYFNYALLRDDGAFEAEQFEYIQRFYFERGVIKHKVLIESRNREAFKECGFAEQYRLKETFVQTELPTRAKEDVKTRLNVKETDEASIEEFTEAYLKGFGSRVREYRKVSKNFRELLILPNVRLYLLKQDQATVGISVMFKDKHECLLAGGAILPEHQNKGFHQESLRFRIATASQDAQITSIGAIATAGSISHQNMEKLAMKTVNKFDVYEYCL